jgi:histone demethylase JARID1
MIDSQRFHFRTRRQELNSVEGGNRVNNDYLDQLAKFHKQNGYNLNRFPSVDKRPLDLYRLKKTVERKGGFDSVCKFKRWAEVGRDLGYSGKIMSSLSTSLKNSYQKWLLPYEEYLRIAKPGVQREIEMMNGGPYTPSPNPSPVKKTPLGAHQVGSENAQQTPLMRASTALHATLNGQNPTSHESNGHHVAHPQPQQSGGFTAVNAGGFTAVNAPSQNSSFVTVNGTNGFSDSTHSTPQRHGNSPHRGEGDVSSSQANGASMKRQHSDMAPDDGDYSSRRSKRLRKDVPTVAGSNMHLSRMANARTQLLRERGEYVAGEICEACARSEESNKFIKCETCDCAYHMYCLEPPMKQPPDHEWHCPRCLVGTNEYGFEEGDVYSLAGFQARANEFKYRHFSNIPRQFSPFNESKNTLEEEDVEREFWRLVEDLTDTTEVEYGADIHSTTHGSGFPTIERQPRDPYSTDPWNLNILPLDKESLFRHIKSDVSGMTVPWLYVGMVFSTFCWHNEDHFTYSANYQHFGETKTWYGIPAEDSYKFEQAMREEVPELFETQPDLLFQLVTLAKPEKLRKAGVNVYAIDQRAGQFVITFPRAYHAGFNHGFNFNEAVNFAPNDWEPFGEEGVKRLREYRKQPCFSHDELLLTAASRDHTIRTAKWLGPALERMLDDELAAREHFLVGPTAESGLAPEEPYTGPRYNKKPEAIDASMEEEEVICTFCKAYCFLSRYVCKKTSKVMCLLHAGHYECCDAPESARHSGQGGEHVLYYRMSDDVLHSTVRKVVDKANIPEAWAAKVDQELNNNPTPSLKHMRTLLTEGEKIQYPLPQLAGLQRFVERCNAWVEEATIFITRKQTGRRKSEKSLRKSNAKAEAEEREKELRKVSNIQDLLARADQLGFDCAEINTLRERANSIEEFQLDANTALNNIRHTTLAQFEELAERGRDYHVDMPELDNLDRVLRRLRWNEMARQKRPQYDTQRQDQSLEDVEKFIAAGRELGVPDTNPDMAFFIEHKAQGEIWETKAKELMAVEQVHYQQLDALSRQAATLPVTPETLAAVEAILRKQREVQDKILSLVERTKDPEFRNRPTYKEMKEVMDTLEELQSKPAGTIDLEKESKRHEDWMRRGKKLFGKANAPLHILHQHMQLVDKRNEACFDLTDKPRGPVEPSSRAVTPEEGAQVAEGSTSSRDVFCICRKPEAGMMIECELCHEWYHGKCLKIARGKVKEDDKYTCPICDWRVKIPRDAARPKLEDLQIWLDELETLPFQPEEEQTLTSICDQGQAFRDFIKPFVEPSVPTTPEDVTLLRFYLRKIEGADILLSPETNFLRQELHRLAPVAPIAPPVIQMSMSTRKPRPTKQQKLMAQLGITDPEELPAQFRAKPNIAKRKMSEIGKAQPVLQPAGAGSPTSANGHRPSSPRAQGTPTVHPTPPANAKKHLTALALQVLGPLAKPEVVDQFLAGEPHANRDRLMKVKAVLESGDPAVLKDFALFKRRVNEVQLPSQVLVYDGVSTGGNRTTKSTTEHPNSHSSSRNPRQSTSSHRLEESPGPYGSAAQYLPHSNQHRSGASPQPLYDPRPLSLSASPMTRALKSPASPDPLGLGLSAGGGAHSANNNNGTISSGMPAGIFDSPKTSAASASGAFPGRGAGSTSSAGLNSPGFGGSQLGHQSPAGGEEMFDDLVQDDHHDHHHHDADDGGAKIDPSLDAAGADAIGPEGREGGEKQVAAARNNIDPSLME